MPEKWHQTTLASIAQWGSGGTPSRKHPEYYGGEVPWVKTGDLGPKVLLAASEYITELGVKKSSAKYFPKGSVAIAMYGATIGKTSILGFDATTNQACAVGQPVNGITDTTFLYYLLRNEKDAFIAKGKGGAQPNISQALIKEHVIALPPLAEQKVIADKLDTLLAQVETTKARLERIPQILKRFRQSVLAAAVSGRLTEEWRGAIAKAYVSKALGELVAEPLRNGKSVKDGDGPRVLRLSALKAGGIDFLESKTGNWDGIQVDRYIVQSGDFLVSRGNGSKDLVGRGGLVGLAAEEIAYPDTMIRIRPQVRSISPEYLAMVWNSQVVRNQIESMARTTAGIWKISQGDLESLLLPLPDITKQTEIVHRVDQLFAHADRIEQQVNKALARVNNLTQSILAKAFRGELTEQWRKDNPELISGENSAEALLERIRAERAAMKPAKRARRKASA